MPEGNNLDLPQEALALFSQCSKPVPVSIQVQLANSALFSLQFNLEDLNKPDVELHKLVGASVTALLNEIRTIKLVQNEMQN